MGWDGRCVSAHYSFWSDDVAHRWLLLFVQVYALTSFIEANNFAQGRVVEMWGESSGGKGTDVGGKKERKIGRK